SKTLKDGKNIEDRQIIIAIGFNETYTTALENSTSQEFLQLSTKICTKIRTLQDMPADTECEVLNFKSGSVYAFIRLTFPNVDESTASNTIDVFLETIKTKVDSGNLGDLKLLVQQRVCVLT
ncbi:hypothetical protein EGW08_013453, partial [Elysia chlorotica]